MKCINKGQLVAMLSNLPDEAWILLEAKNSPGGVSAGFVVFEQYSSSKEGYITLKTIYDDPIKDVERNPQAIVLAAEKPENLPDDMRAVQRGGNRGEAVAEALAAMLAPLADHLKQERKTKLNPCGFKTEDRRHMEEKPAAVPAPTGEPDYVTNKGTLTDAGRARFEELCNPLIDFMCGNFHPHVHVVITPTAAEISEGIGSFYTEKYLRD